MNRSQRIGVALAGILLVGVLAAGGTLAEGAGAGAGAGKAGGVTLAGAGATFPAPLYQRWLLDYKEVRPELDVSYEPVGSGEGVKRFLAGTVDFGASDAAMSDAELQRVDPRRGVAMVPMTAGMVVLAYNIPGIGAGLTLGRDAYLGIFSGKIRYWDDPRIAADNPRLSLPHKSIMTVVRRDSSGTTFLFTNHLGAIDARWIEEGPGVGKLVDWPSNAMSVSGNAGVAQRVKITDGAIGYMEYEFAERLGLPIATLKNRSGQPVVASPASGQAALATARETPPDLRVFVPDPAGPDSYPIVGYSWVLLGRHYSDSNKAQALRELFAWGLAEGQGVARDLGYVPLPEAMIAKAREALAQVR